MKLHDRPLITYQNDFFRKGDKVRVMWNKELRELGYDVYFNEDGDLMDGTNKAREVAKQTMKEVKQAMKLNYFE